MAKRHLIGVGGVGMSALATALVRLGDEVTGADRTLDAPNVRFLESIGVKVFPDDGSGVGADVDEVIVSTAIEETNPGLRKARELGVPVVHRAKALARALSGRRLVAVVGTCGKSTVTAMLGHVLDVCGLDPLCVNGANVPGWEGAVRFGRGEYAVAEVDESDRSLVAFSPYAAIVTNASADHYSKEEMNAVFDAFVRDCPGPVIDGREVEEWRSGKVEKWRSGEVEEWKSGEVEKWKSGGVEELTDEVETSMPGAHNRQNAALALRMALALGCDERMARAALASFGGVERRLQRVSGHGDVPAVYDDYAHNTEKLHAMLTTLQERFADGVCAVWRPHGYAPLRKMKDALAAMFAATLRPQDALLLLPVYDAGGTADRTVSSADLLSAVAAADASAAARVALAAGHDEALAWCAERAGRFGCFATCGARDPGLPLLARRIADATRRSS